MALTGEIMPIITDDEHQSVVRVADIKMALVMALEQFCEKCTAVEVVAALHQTTDSFIREIWKDELNRQRLN